MKKTPLFASLLCVLISTCALAVNGDMGGADPNGSPEKPYLIEDLADFDTFADPNNAATYWAAGIHTKLMTDIDLAGRIYTTAVISPDTGFAGIFDGNGLSIRNLTIDTAGTNNRFIGLFRTIKTAVKNLGIDNITIRSNSTLVAGLTGTNSGTITNCHVTGSISGWGIVGGICGYNEGGITDSYVIGTISGNDYVGGICGKSIDSDGLNNCYTAGTVDGEENFIGGLCGINNANTTNCHSNSDVSGNSRVGGLVGSNQGGSLTNCYSTGDVSGIAPVGGLVGETQGNITNCYSTGLVTGGLAGGLVGYKLGGSLTNCFWDVETSGIGNTGDDNFGATGKTTAQMQVQSTFTDWDFTTPDWMMLRELEDYPRLAWQEVFAGDIAGLYGADMVDFAYLANYWGLTGCNSGIDCGRADIDGSNDVGLGDLAAVANDWLM